MHSSISLGIVLLSHAGMTHLAVDWAMRTIVDVRNTNALTTGFDRCTYMRHCALKVGMNGINAAAQRAV
jgi:hypothetical protein